MKLIRLIPHEKYKIQIFQFAGNFILKIELDQFEQSFKLSESKVADVEEFQNLITDEFLVKCLHRFIAMRTEWNSAFQQKNNV